jgi:hypothetical protein
LSQACGLHGRDEKCGAPGGRKHPEDLTELGAIIKMELKEVVW